MVFVHYRTLLCNSIINHRDDQEEKYVRNCFTQPDTRYKKDRGR